MKSFSELAELRRSVRAYREEAVPEELVLKVLDTARKAPSACNKQPWRFVVVRGEEQRRKLGLAYSREWFWKAPVIVAVCVVTGDGRGRMLIIIAHLTKPHIRQWNNGNRIGMWFQRGILRTEQRKIHSPIK